MAKDKPKFTIRLVAFILVLAVAIASFVIGVLQYIHRDAGFYDVGYNAEAQTVAFGSGVHYLLYAEGSSGAIRQATSAAQNAFSAALVDAYRLLDARTEYEGINNLAALNHHPGVDYALDPRLYAVLQDALERTQRGEGYSLYAGALQGEWQTLLYLEDPLAFDPSLLPREAELMQALAAFAAPEHVLLRLNADGSARLVLSEDYTDYLEQNGLEHLPALDTNLLHDAYLLPILAQSLAQASYREGYLYTESGFSMVLDAQGSMAYTLLAAQGEELVSAGEVTLASPSAFCQFTAVPNDEQTYGWYTLQSEGKTTYRHAYVDVRTGLPSGAVMTAAVGGGADQMVNMAYALLRLALAPDAEAAAALAGQLPDALYWAYTLQGDSSAAPLYTQKGAAK